MQESLLGTLKTIQAEARQLNLSVADAYQRFLSVVFAAFAASSYEVSFAIDLRMKLRRFQLSLLLRKEVIQPHLPIRLPCYDFTPIINPTFGSVPLVRLLTSGVIDSHGVTGGVYKARERIHRGMLIRDY